MRYSDSPEGKAWLGNFEPSEVVDARLLLDSVSFITESEFYATMTKFAARVAKAGEPVAVFAAQGVPKTGFFTAPDDLRPDGSELIVLSILNKFATERVIVSPSVEDMRQKKIRNIAIFTDLAGSGDEVTKFVDFLYNNPTIRSWHSGHLVRFSIYSFAIQDRALHRLETDRRQLGVSWELIAPTLFSMPWPSDQLQRIAGLCRNYSNQPSRAFGWGDEAAMICFPHTTPNNLPMIFLQKTGKSGRDWTPLLPYTRKRGINIPTWIGLFGSKTEFDAQSFLDAIEEGGNGRKLHGYERAAVLRAESGIGSALTPILVLLSSGDTSESSLVAKSRTSFSRVEAVIELAISLDLLDEGRNVTRRGKSFLRARSRRRTADPKSSPPTPEKVYYPRSLR